MGGDDGIVRLDVTEVATTFYMKRAAALLAKAPSDFSAPSFQQDGSHRDSLLADSPFFHALLSLKQEKNAKFAREVANILGKFSGHGQAELAAWADYGTLLSKHTTNPETTLQWTSILLCVSQIRAELQNSIDLWRVTGSATLQNSERFRERVTQYHVKQKEVLDLSLKCIKVSTRAGELSLAQEARAILPTLMTLITPKGLA